MALILSYSSPHVHKPLAVFIVLAVVIIVLLIMILSGNKQSEQPDIGTVDNYIKKLMTRARPVFTYPGTKTPVWEGSSVKGTAADVLRTKIIKRATDNKYLIEIDWVLVGLIVNRGWCLKHDDIQSLRNARDHCFQKPGEIDKWCIYYYASQMNRTLDRNYIDVFFSDTLEDCFEISEEYKNLAAQYTKDYSSYIGNNIDGPDGHGLRVKCKRLYDYCEMYIFERELFSREKPASDYYVVVKEHNNYIKQIQKKIKAFMFRFSRGEETIDLDMKKEWERGDLYLAIMCNKRQLERHALVNNPEKAKKIFNPPPPKRPRDPHDEYMDWMNGFTGIQSP